MPTFHRSSFVCATCALVALLVACQAPPPKPPLIRTVVAPSAPPGARPLPGTPGSPAAGAPGNLPGGSGQGYGTAVPNAAVVVEEEVAPDGSVRTVNVPAGDDASAARGQTPDDAGGGGGYVPPARYARHAGPGTGGGAPLHATGAERGAAPLGAGLDIGTRGAGQDDVLTAPPVSDTARANREAAERLGVESGLDEGHGQRVDAGDGGRGAGGAASQSTGLGATPDVSGATSGHFTPRPAASVARPTPPIKADVLAEQLRTAAEQERDPALREKLWAEYRRYKAGLDAAP